MSHPKFFPHRDKVKHPYVVVKSINQTGTETWITKIQNGLFFRVIPRTWREIMAVQMMEQYREKFAPGVSVGEGGNGHGVLISAEAMAKLDAMI